MSPARRFPGKENEDLDNTPRRASRRMAARRSKPAVVKSASRELLEWIVCIIVAVALALTFNTFVAQLIIVDGSSMAPTLHNGERMFVTRYTYRFRLPERGEVVILHYPDAGDRDNYVKRVVGLPGDTVEIQGGILYVNDQAIDEPYLAEPMEDGLAKLTVPEGCVYVLGDNRNISRDSRYFDVGPIALDHLLGEVHAVAWPPGGVRVMTDYTRCFDAADRTG